MLGVVLRCRRRSKSTVVTCFINAILSARHDRTVEELFIIYLFIYLLAFSDNLNDYSYYVYGYIVYVERLAD